MLHMEDEEESGLEDEEEATVTLSMEKDALAVSYTHLTLPTICSV